MVPRIFFLIRLGVYVAFERMMPEPFTNHHSILQCVIVADELAKQKFPSLGEANRCVCVLYEEARCESCTQLHLIVSNVSNGYLLTENM